MPKEETTFDKIRYPTDLIDTFRLYEVLENLDMRVKALEEHMKDKK